MACKRPSCVEGNTPGKPPNKRDTGSSSGSNSRKQLFGDSKLPKVTKESWKDAEDSALVQYICLFSPEADSNKWPSTKDVKFWSGCADAVNKACNTSRTGNKIILSFIEYGQIITYLF